MSSFLEPKWLLETGSRTCRQSRAVTTIWGHLDWQASSNGKKYLSASIYGCFPFGGGSAEEGLSSLQIKKTEVNIHDICIAGSCRWRQAVMQRPLKRY